MIGQQQTKSDSVSNNGTKKIKLVRPDRIKAHLDQYVIGQDEAKRTLSVAVYNHYKRLIQTEQCCSDLEIDKSNVVLLGETGCGKTLMVKTIAKMLNVPCYIQDCTKITASGYVGSDVEDCLCGLLRSCNYDKEAAEMGIVVLDEGDKMARKEAGPSITRDVSGECVQQSLLKIVEGDLVGVPPMGGRKHPEQSLIRVNTKNILFILAGAFVGLDDIIKRRMGRKSIGFSIGEDTCKDIADTDYVNFATPQDLRDFGLIPELVGRFPVIANVNALGEDELVRILCEPKNSLVRQYRALLAMDGVKLTFSDDALRAIARMALTLGTGARGLRSIMETTMKDIMYNAPRLAKTQNTIDITEETVTEAIATHFRCGRVC